MPTLCVVPCGKAKIWDRAPEAGPTPARRAYVRGLALETRRYAEAHYADWVVLSAKHGFLRPDDLVPGWYDVTFNRPGPEVVDLETLRRQLREKDLERFDDVVVLAGRIYADVVRRAFEPLGARVRAPLEGLAGLPRMRPVLARAWREGRAL